MRVSYTKTSEGKSERVEKEAYKIYAGPANIATAGYAGVKSVFPKAKVRKMSKEFEDRLYLINNMIAATPNTTRVVWNNPMGGALEWNRYPQNAIYDTKGELRWYMEPSRIYDPDNVYKAGIMMGFRQNNDGAFTWGYGQRYVKYDLMGREVFNRRLPDSYADFSHAMDPMQNGNYLVRVASSDHVRPDGKHVHTVRDVIIEVDRTVRSSTNGVSGTFSTRIAIPFSRCLTRAPSASTSTRARPARRSPPKNSPEWTRTTSSATSWAPAQASTGCTSTPSTMTRPTTPSSSPRAISPL